MRPRRSTQDRQQELTDAALHLIATRGIAALSTRSLAEVVGLSSGAIFRHFRSLDDLLLSVVGRVEQVLAATYPPPDLPANERLALLIRARSRAVGQQLGILRLVLSEQFLLSLPEGCSARLLACVQETRRYVESCLEEAQAAGTVRRDLPPQVLAPIVMGTIQMLALAPAGASFPEPDAIEVGLLNLLSPPSPAPERGRKKRT
ncbi:MAG: TetR/AcrR family transcriptional regulator [Deltaproteobacteria bacterium]|nr:TetR/AcrR family transcriptional regulator [Deltaproteobacteria bacterium]